MRNRRLFWSMTVAAAAGTFVACGSHMPPAPPGPPTEPRMTWQLKTGGDFGDKTFVCGSARPDAPCSLTATPEGGRSSVSVELYVYPSDALTYYSGVIRLPFIQGWSPLNARDVSGAIPPGSRPVQTSVTGLVTGEAGDYQLRIALDAVEENRESHRLVVSVPVTVRPANGS